MWASLPIEKIRKAQWTAENTAKTQALVDDLRQLQKSIDDAWGTSPTGELIGAAIQRLQQLDKGVK